MAGLLVGETCSGMLDLRAWFGGSVESKTGSLLLGLNRLADQEGPVIGLDASHLPLLVDGLADSSCRSGGFPELDDDGQQRGLQFLGIGVQHDQSVQDPLPQRLAGNVCLLVPGPGAGRRSTCRKQDPREVSGANPVQWRVVGLGSWHVGNATIRQWITTRDCFPRSCRTQRRLATRRSS